MGKDQITGLTLKNDFLEWTTLEKAKDTFKSVDTGRDELGIKSPEEGGDNQAPQPDIGSIVKKHSAKLRGRVTLGLSSEQLLIRVVKLPSVPEEDLKGMVELQVDKLSPFPIENMVVSYEILSKTADSYLVLAAAAKNDVVDSTGKILAQSGIFPGRVDANVLGWWRLLKDSGNVKESGRQIFVIMADGVPDVIVSQDGIPVVFRSLNEKGPLTDDEFYSEIARDVAYSMIALDLEYGGGHCSMSVWHRGDKPLLLAEKMRLECPCEVFLKALDSLPPVTEGLARRTADAGQLLDLTPDSWRLSGGEKLFKHRMIMGALVVIGIWALCVVLFAGGLFYQQKRVTSLEAELKTTQLPADEVISIRKRVSIITRYSDRTRSSLECLREITMLMPEGVEMTSFEYKRASNPPGVTINGQAPSVSLVYDFKGSLDASKIFLKGTLKGPFEQKGKQVFQIDMKLPGGGE